MIDFLKWTERARAFVRGLAGLPGKVGITDSIEPPAMKDRDKRRWLRSGQCSLPPEIHEFVGLASERCTFGYSWTPPAAWLPRLQPYLSGGESLTGGADLCEANKYYLYDGRHDFRSLFKSLPLSPGLAEHSMPTNERGKLLCLATLDDDHELVLELNAADGQRGVGCASTREGSEFQRLSPSFEKFLMDWEAIGYITPRPEFLTAWLDPVTGLLNPDLDEAKAFREVLREATTP